MGKLNTKKQYVKTKGQAKTVIWQDIFGGFLCVYVHYHLFAFPFSDWTYGDSYSVVTARL